MKTIINQRYPHIHRNWFDCIYIFMLVIMYSLSSYLFDVNILGTFKYLIYIFVYDFIVGFSLCYLFQTHDFQREYLIIKSIFVGFIFEAFTTFIFKFIGIEDIHIWRNLLCVLIVGITFIVHIKSERKREYGFRNNFEIKPQIFIISLAFVITWIVALSIFSRQYFDLNLIKSAAVSESCKGLYPFKLPFMHGTTMFYNYFMHLHIANAAQITGVGTITIAGKLMPLTFYPLLILLIIYFSLKKFKTYWPGILAVIQSLMLTQGGWITNYLLFASGPAMFRSATSLFSMAAFIIISDEILAIIKQFTKIKLIFLMLFIAAIVGIRSSLLPIIGFGLGGLFLYGLCIEKRVNFILLILGIWTCLMYYLGNIYIYGSNEMVGISKFYKIGFSLGSFRKSNLFVISSIFACGVAVIGRFTFLVPALATIPFIIKKRLHDRLTIYSLSAFSFGLLAVFYVHNNGYSQYKSYYNGHMFVALILSYQFILSIKKGGFKRKLALGFILIGIFLQVFDIGGLFYQQYYKKIWLHRGVVLVDKVGLVDKELTEWLNFNADGNYQYSQTTITTLRKICYLKVSCPNILFYGNKDTFKKYYGAKDSRVVLLKQIYDHLLGKKDFIISMEKLNTLSGKRIRHICEIPFSTLSAKMKKHVVWHNNNYCVIGL